MLQTFNEEIRITCAQHHERKIREIAQEYPEIGRAIFGKTEKYGKMPISLEFKHTDKDPYLDNTTNKIVVNY